MIYNRFYSRGGRGAIICAAAFTGLMTVAPCCGAEWGIGYQICGLSDKSKGMAERICDIIQKDCKDGLRELDKVQSQPEPTFKFGDKGRIVFVLESKKKERAKLTQVINTEYAGLKAAIKELLELPSEITFDDGVVTEKLEAFKEITPSYKTFEDMTTLEQKKCSAFIKRLSRAAVKACQLQREIDVLQGMAEQN